MVTVETALHLLAGILLGGLVNALADNLPQGRLLAVPRYGDGAIRPPQAWLGLGAFLFKLRHSPERGRSGETGPLSWRYPLTELALAGLLVATEYAAGAQSQAALGQQWLWQLYIVVFVLLAVVDIKRKQILFLPVVMTSALAVFDAAVFPGNGPDLTSSLAGGAVGGMVFALVYAGGQFYSRNLTGERDTPTAFGKGDIYLMAMGGLIVGYPNALLAMVAAVFLAGAGALTWLLGMRLRGRRYERYTALPYGPYILAATYVVMLLPGAISL